MHPEFSRRTASADRRRRELAAYRRAVRAAADPAERAAVAGRYNRVFATGRPVVVTLAS